MSIPTKDDGTHAYVLVLKFSTYVLCDISVIGTETSVLLMGSMKARKKARFNGQSSVTMWDVMMVARRETLLSVRRSDPTPSNPTRTELMDSDPGSIVSNKARPRTAVASHGVIVSLLYPFNQLLMAVPTTKNHKIKTGVPTEFLRSYVTLTRSIEASMLRRSRCSWLQWSVSSLGLYLTYGERKS